MHPGDTIARRMRSACHLRSVFLVAAMLLALAGGAGAAEQKKTEARRLYDEATAAFGVGNYAEAAEKYEASFKLHPDAALLYNAAQAYRMAGNPARALQLYRNFVRLYATTRVPRTRAITRSRWRRPSPRRTSPAAWPPRRLLHPRTARHARRRRGSRRRHHMM